MKFLAKLFIFSLVLISLNFFDAHFLNKTVVNYIVFITLSFTIAISVPFTITKNKGFVLPVKLIVLSIAISVLMASLSWGQSIKDSIIETVPYLLWIFFFYLLHQQVPIYLIEKIVLFYGALYIILYFFQLSRSPAVIFGKSLWGDEFTIDRGITRIVFPGAGVFILAVFIAINKLTTQSNGRLLWILFTFLGLLIPILQVTRQFIAGMVIIYFFHFLKGQTVLKKLAVIIFFIGVFLFVSNLNNPIINGLRKAAQEDFGEGENYIRLLAGKYFISEFSPDNINIFLGNGTPYSGVSYYGLYVQNLETENGYFLSDVGIIGMYTMFGLLPIIGYILIWIKSVKIPVPNDYYYLKYYLWYLLFTSFTWFSVYHYHYLISTVFVIYLYQKIYLQSENLKFHTKIT